MVMEFAIDDPTCSWRLRDLLQGKAGLEHCGQGGQLPKPEPQGQGPNGDFGGFALDGNQGGLCGPHARSGARPADPDEVDPDLEAGTPTSTLEDKHPDFARLNRRATADDY